MSGVIGLLSTIVGTVGGSIVTFLFARKKYLSEVYANDIKSMQESLKFYTDMVMGNRKELLGYQEDLRNLRNENRQLRDEMTQVKEENVNLKLENAQLKAQINSMAERMTKYEEKTF